MSTKRHYFIEETKNKQYAVRAKGSNRASGVFDTQHEAIERAHDLNPDGHPEVERVRETSRGGHGKWRASEE